MSDWFGTPDQIIYELTDSERFAFSFTRPPILLRAICLHQVERLTDAIYSAVAAFSPAEALEDDATVVIVRAKEI